MTWDSHNLPKSLATWPWYVSTIIHIIFIWSLLAEAATATGTRKKSFLLPHNSTSFYHGDPQHRTPHTQFQQWPTTMLLTHWPNTGNKIMFIPIHVEIHVITCSSKYSLSIPLKSPFLQLYGHIFLNTSSIPTPQIFEHDHLPHSNSQPGKKVNTFQVPNPLRTVEEFFLILDT